MLRALARGVVGGAATAATAAIVLSQPQRPRVHAEPSIADSVAQLPPPEKLGVDGTAHFSCFRGTGEPVALSKVLEAAQLAEVCLIGETHDDPVAHQLELYLLVQMQSRRPCLLSLEMFETDVQPIVDEYLAGLIREDDLLQDARPWTNYSKDYRQMVEFCKGQAMPVSAANVPRRYVGAIGRDANALLEGAWPAATHARLPPLPLPRPSPGYLQHLLADPAVLRTDQLGLSGGDAGGGSNSGKAGDGKAGDGSGGDGSGGDGSGGGGEGAAAAKAGGCPYIGLSRRDGLLQPMLLWDAGMALSISRALAQHPERLIYHVCGSFHCEGKQLTATHPRPAARCPRGRPPLQRPVPARGCPPHPSARQERPRRVGALEEGALLHAHTR